MKPPFLVPSSWCGTAPANQRRAPQELGLVDTQCSFDDDSTCGCSSTIDGISTADDVDSLTSEERYDYLSDFWDLIYVDLGAADRMQKHSYSRSGGDYTGYVPIYTKGDHIGDPVSWEELDSLNKLLLKTQLFPGKR